MLSKWSRVASRRLRPRLRRALSTEKDSLLSFHEAVATSMNATARLLGVTHRVRVEEKRAPRAASAAPAAAAPPARQPRLSSALRYMSDADIDAYTSELVGGGHLGDFEGLPAQFQAAERYVYGHCVKILLRVMHDGVDALPDARVLGLRVDAAPAARPPLDLLGALRRRLARDDRMVVDAARVAAFVDRVLEVEREATSGGEAGAAGAVERALHDNVAAIVVNLLADAASTFRLDCFGHSLRVDVAPNDALDALDLDELRRRRAARESRPRLFGDAHVRALVDEILADDTINLAYVPDIVEEQFYRRVFTFYSVVLDYVLRDIRLSVLDVDLALSLERD